MNTQLILRSPVTSTSLFQVPRLDPMVGAPGNHQEERPTIKQEAPTTLDEPLQPEELVSTPYLLSYPIVYAYPQYSEVQFFGSGQGITVDF